MITVITCYKYPVSSRRTIVEWVSQDYGVGESHYDRSLAGMCYTPFRHIAHRG